MRFPEGKAFPCLQPAKSGLTPPLRARGAPLATLPPQIALAIAATALLATPPLAADPLATVTGPIAGIVAKTIDGDTVEVDAQPWPDMTINVRIRLADIQAPEIFHPGCSAEADAGRAAAVYIQSILAPGHSVTLHNVRPGKYARRMAADIKIEYGQNVAALLVQAGHAKPWPKNGQKPSWCQR